MRSGFRKLSDELKNYPEIEIKFNEPGLSFQVQFIKTNYSKEKYHSTVDAKLEQAGTKLAPSRH